MAEQRNGEGGEASARRGVTQNERADRDGPASTKQSRSLAPTTTASVATVPARAQAARAPEIVRAENPISFLRTDALRRLTHRRRVAVCIELRCAAALSRPATTPLLDERIPPHDDGMALSSSLSSLSLFASNHRIAAIVALLVALICCVAGQSHRVEKSRRIGTEGQIIARIFGDYDAFARPPVSDFAQNSGAVIVFVNAYINRVTWDGAQAHVDLYLRQQWEDNRLMFDVDPREGINEVTVPNNRQIWNPDTYFTIGEERDGPSKRQVIVEHSGYVRVSEQKSITVPVTYGSHFPFSNTRTFSLRLSSYAYNIGDVIHLWTDSPPALVPVEVADEVQDGAFVFSDAQVVDCVGNYTAGQYSCIEVEVTFHGSMSEPIFRVFIPSVFLIVVSWLHFWVHGSWSVPRTVSAALPFFLFAAVFVFYPQPYLALSGVGGLQVWFTFCLGITFLSLLEYFFVICCGVRRSVHYYRAGSETEHPLTAAREAAEEAYETRCASFKQRSGLDILSRVLFPLIFIVFVVLYLLWYLLL